jgi:hypothetical protein
LYLDHQIREDEIGGTCSTQEREEKSVKSSDSKTLRGHFEDVGVDVRTVK